MRPDADGNLTHIFRTKEQQYSFNFPYQCGTGAELPYAADDFAHEIRDNDIIVMASDGVFDNLFDRDLEACVKPEMKGSHFADLQAAADCIANKSEKLGNTRNYKSPFYMHAVEMGVRYPPQGKADDITVICA